ncbi:aspartic proteinase 36-like [Bidens hawaiensis]|uniref:aspartic proteinase 36-like n=1 Tax=Bidens hawaiensis TaxID=980011 RepID=UPI00404A4094
MEGRNLVLVLVICVFVSVAVVELGTFVSANVVFQVHHKFHVKNTTLSAYIDHDSHRRRILSSTDLHIGGSSNPTYVGLYYTKICIGSPPKAYHVQIDTGSDIMWVNCAGCVNCPKTSDLGVPLSLYDPQESSSSRTVACEEDFCTIELDPSNNRCVLGTPCPYIVKYSDGSSKAGYFVNDIVQLNKISGNLKTTNMTGNIMFGCGARQSGTFGKTRQALDGVLGFAQSNSSMISQLASSEKVKKMFSHCLTRSKGGIFTIGEVVHPKVNTTPLLPNMAHFSIELKAIQVDKDFVTFPAYMLNNPAKREAIIDSGTTLAYFPQQIYSQLMEMVMAAQPGVDVHTFDNKFKCYAGEGNVDNAFPIVTFHFANAMKLRVHPSQYIFRTPVYIYAPTFYRPLFIYFL